MEYMLIVALTLALILPTTYIFYNYSKESSQEITDAQITKLGRSIVDTAASIFYTGSGSRTTLKLDIPKGVSSALIIDGRELVFNVTTSFGVSEAVFFSSVNLTTISSNCIVNVCRIPELASSGIINLKIEALNNSVLIEPK